MGYCDTDAHGGATSVTMLMVQLWHVSSVRKKSQRVKKAQTSEETSSAAASACLCGHTHKIDTRHTQRTRINTGHVHTAAATPALGALEAAEQ